ncbi:hypothetical protein ANAPC5_01343 [Anaplasma phagocytophilum]|nr:hypothetical protein ANAPC5_01343 [Anaplasma phagocytophilum]
MAPLFPGTRGFSTERLRESVFSVVFFFSAFFLCGSLKRAHFTQRSAAECLNTLCFTPSGSNTNALKEDVRLAQVSNQWENEHCVGA